MMKIRTIIAGSGQDEDTRVEYLLEETEIDVHGRITDLSVGLEVLDREKPELVLITGTYDRKMQMFCQQAYILYPMCVIVLLTGDADAELYNTAMENGIRRVISPIPDKDHLVSILKETCISEQSRRGNITGENTGRTRTEVLFVFGAKGGIGKTALAVNLATRLAMAKRKVILLDCDMQFGDTGQFLGMDPKDTLAELLQEQRSPTLDTVNSFLTYHQSGLRVLAAPKSPEYAEIIGGKSVDKIVSVLRNYYDYIIIDGAVGFSEVNLALLDLCSQILFVTQPELCTLKNTKKAFLLIQSLNMEQKLKVVLMGMNSGGISQADVEKVLGRRIDAAVSRDEKTMIACLNQGRPVVLGAPKSRLGGEYGKLAAMVERGFTAGKTSKLAVLPVKSKGKRR